MYTVTKNVKFLQLSKRLYYNDTEIKKSVFLPKTKFKSWLSTTQMLERDNNVYESCEFSELYSWQRQNVNSNEFILHDGPPYANGLPHMGHAVNKILKDITIRHKLVNGSKINYVPGWDCHGLPIELKVEKLNENNWNNFSPLEVRKRAKLYATKEIEKQKAIFRSWGILADWDLNCYYTYEKKYIKKQLYQFYNLYKKGLIYRDLKPVYWSPSSKSALAEAELEYNPNHLSKSVTVKFELCSSSLPIEIKNYCENSVFALIWTTTPWTLPDNAAIVYSPVLNYSLVKITGISDTYLLASDLITNLSTKLKKNIKIITTFKGNCLSGLKYKSLRCEESDKQFFAGDHVTADKGTGLIHTAPAYSHEDFLVALNYNIPIKCHVDESGVYTHQSWLELKGLSVLDKGNDMVLSLLSNKILHLEMYEHSYPYDWRTKLPVIVRASKQWFLDTSTIKRQSIESLQNVEIYPEQSGSRNSLLSLIKKRPYWCISRQRMWGIPIPVLYDNLDNEILDENLLKNYNKLLNESGLDFWWTEDVQKLVLNTSHEKSNLQRRYDILDIWFDSGISWSCVLGDDKVADLYVEGVDQCTGWFQSSLMLSVALRNISPYKSLFIHGFVVDEKGRKMSKSIGNVVDPQDIINGKYEKSISGIDNLRLYCNHINSSERLACVATIQATFETLLKHISPILPHLAEESYQFYPLKKSTYFKSPKLCINEVKISDSENVKNIIDNALIIKNDVTNVLKGLNSLEYSLTIGASNEAVKQLQILHPDNKATISDLIELYQVNSINLVTSDSIFVKKTKSISHLCKRCRKWTADKQNGLCLRCKLVIEEFYLKKEYIYD
ncbi:isoleucine--tRNA ligase, mitochondrial isoform X3 [Daktulosphaira vitifoliae]|uniref:isoleucine--tRNA ligase, mitochondrial isoform X3 n=1 Tax=Daktulosphaira vitifoliae TaxID=58002 RepID=UPI0021AA99D5|nr:isoleucine--tRNA ligase, mitochondrial isoform X3 [Daktulosphaira vitifoliae]